MMKSLVLEPGPGDAPALDQVDLDRRRSRRSRPRRRTARRRPGVPWQSPRIEIGVLVLDREVDDGARRHVGQVHVAAPVVGLQRGDRLDLGRDAERADEGLVGQRDPVVELARPASVTSIFFTRSGSGCVEHRGVGGGDQAAELRDQRGGADRLRPARHDRVDVDREHVALLRALDRDRPVLRVDEGHVEHRRRQVGLGLDRPLEGVDGLGHDPVAGPDAAARARHRGRRRSDTCPASPRSGNAARRSGPGRRPAGPCATSRASSSIALPSTRAARQCAARRSRPASRRGAKASSGTALRSGNRAATGASGPPAREPDRSYCCTGRSGLRHLLPKVDEGIASLAEK